MKLWNGSSAFQLICFVYAATKNIKDRHHLHIFSPLCFFVLTMWCRFLSLIFLISTTLLHFPPRLLGCFSDTKKLGPTGVFPSNAQPFQRLLEDEATTGGCAGDSVCPTLKHCSKLFIYLYKMATDSFDRSVCRNERAFRPIGCPKSFMYSSFFLL